MLTGPQPPMGSIPGPRPPAGPPPPMPPPDRPHMPMHAQHFQPPPPGALPLFMCSQLASARKDEGKRYPRRTLELHLSRRPPAEGAMLESHSDLSPGQ